MRNRRILFTGCVLIVLFFVASTSFRDRIVLLFGTQTVDVFIDTSDVSYVVYDSHSQAPFCLDYASHQSELDRVFRLLEGSYTLESYVFTRRSSGGNGGGFSLYDTQGNLLQRIIVSGGLLCEPSRVEDLYYCYKKIGGEVDFSAFDTYLKGYDFVYDADRMMNYISRD